MSTATATPSTKGARRGRRRTAPLTSTQLVYVVLGLIVVALGVVLLLVDRVPWIGRLPGDVHLQRGNWTFYFPLGTSILLSVVLTLVLWLIGRR